MNHEAGDALLECVASLRAEGVAEVTVVDNASSDGSADALVAVDGAVRLVQTGANLGYGAGANRGIDVTCVRARARLEPRRGRAPRGAGGARGKVLDADPTLAIAGPGILEPDGTRYPSARRFPSLLDAAGHALLGDLVPTNPFTRRYRMGYLDAEDVTEVDWVSGACFLARRRALEELRRVRRVVLHVRRGHRPVLAGPPGRAGGSPTCRAPSSPISRASPPPAGPTACSSPITAPCSASPTRTERGWRRLALPAMARVPGAASGRDVRQAGPGRAARRLGPGRVGLAPDHGQGRCRKMGGARRCHRRRAELPRAEAHEVVRQPGHDLPAWAWP